MAELTNCCTLYTTINATTERMVAEGDEYFIEKLDFYLSGIVLLLVCVLGLISNTFVVIVLTRKSMKSSTNCFLLALALFDSLVLICTSFMICLKPLSASYRTLVYPRIIPYVYPLALIAQTCTIWITVSFTVERFIAVRHPLKANSMCTVKRARVTAVSVAVISIIYNFSRWFEYTAKVEEVNVNNSIRVVTVAGTNLPSYRIVPTALEQNQVYEYVYFTGLYLTIMCIIPVILLAVLNYFLIQAVRKSRRERLTMANATSNKENNITIMLVSVVAVFIICQVPALVYNVAYGVTKAHVTHNRSWKILSIIRNFMVTINSAINFLLYCAFGQKFRKCFIKLFCKKSQPWRSRWSSERRTMTTTNGSSVNLPMLDRNYNSKTVDTFMIIDGDAQL